MIKITKLLCRAGYPKPRVRQPMLSECGDWITTGEWAIQTASAIIDCAIDPTRKPPMAPLLESLAPLKYRDAELLDVEINSCVPITVDGSIVAWVQTRYRSILDLGPLKAAGKLDPIKVDDVALVMPILFDLNTEVAAALEAWLKKGGASK